MPNGSQAAQLKPIVNIATPEAQVRVISYQGSASDDIGCDGDFYVDELTNILYGPKCNGAWPEEGVAVDGPVLAKRSFIQLNTARATPRSNGSRSFHPWLFLLRLLRLR